MLISLTVKQKIQVPEAIHFNLVIEIQRSVELNFHHGFCSRFKIELRLDGAAGSQFLPSSYYFSFDELIHILVKDYKLPATECLELALTVFHQMMAKQICFEIDEGGVFHEIAHAHLFDLLLSPDIKMNPDGILADFLIQTQYWQNNKILHFLKFIPDYQQAFMRLSGLDLNSQAFIHYLHQTCEQFVPAHILLLFSFSQSGWLYRQLNPEIQAELMPYLGYHAYQILNMPSWLNIDELNPKQTHDRHFIKMRDLNHFFNLQDFVPFHHDSDLTFCSEAMRKVFVDGKLKTKDKLIPNANIYLIDDSVWSQDIQNFLALISTDPHNMTIVLAKKSNIPTFRVLRSAQAIIIEYSHIQEVLWHPCILAYLSAINLVNLQHENDLHPIATWTYWLNQFSLRFTLEFDPGQYRQELIRSQISTFTYPEKQLDSKWPWQIALSHMARGYRFYFADAESIKVKTELLGFLRYVMAAVRHDDRDQSLLPCIVLNIKQQRKSKWLKSVIFEEFGLVLSHTGQEMLDRDPKFVADKMALVIYQDISASEKNDLIYHFAEKKVFLTHGNLWLSLILAQKYPCIWQAQTNPSVEYLKKNIEYILRFLSLASQKSRFSGVGLKRILLSITQAYQGQGYVYPTEAEFIAFRQQLINWIYPPTEPESTDEPGDDLSLILASLEEPTYTTISGNLFSEKLILTQDDADDFYPDVPVLGQMTKTSTDINQKMLPTELVKFKEPKERTVIQKKANLTWKIKRKRIFCEASATIYGIFYYEFENYLKECCQGDTSSLIFHPEVGDKDLKIIRLNLDYLILDFARIIKDERIVYKLIRQIQGGFQSKIDMSEMNLMTLPHFTIGEAIIFLKISMDVFYQLEIPLSLSKSNNYSLVMSIILDNIVELLEKDPSGVDCSHYLSYLNTGSGFPSGLLSVVEQLKVHKINLLGRQDLLRSLSVHALIYRSYLSCIGKLSPSIGLYQQFIKLIHQDEQPLALFSKSLPLQMASMLDFKPFVNRANPNLGKHVLITVVPDGYGDVSFSRQFLNVLGTEVDPKNITWICLFFNTDKIKAMPAEMLKTHFTEITFLATAFEINSAACFDLAVIEKIIGANVWVGPTCLHLNPMQLNVLENLAVRVNQFIYYDPPASKKTSYPKMYQKYQELFSTGFSHAGVFLAETETLMAKSHDICELPILSAIGMGNREHYQKNSVLYSGYWARESHPLHASNLFSAKLFMALCVQIELFRGVDKHIDILVPYALSEQEISETSKYLSDMIPKLDQNYDLCFFNQLTEIRPLNLSGSSKKRLAIICYGVLSKVQRLSLQNVSEPLTVATGDQSILEALHQVPIYQVMDWKAETRDHLLKMTQDLGLHKLKDWWQLTSNYVYKLKPRRLKLNSSFNQLMIQQIARFYVTNSSVLMSQVQAIYLHIKEKFNLDQALKIWIKTQIEAEPKVKKSWQQVDRIEITEELDTFEEGRLVSLPYLSREQLKRYSRFLSQDSQDEAEKPIEDLSLSSDEDSAKYDLFYDEFTNEIVRLHYHPNGVIDLFVLMKQVIQDIADYPKFFDLMRSLVEEKIPFVSGVTPAFFYAQMFYLVTAVHEERKNPKKLDVTALSHVFANSKYWLDAPKDLFEKSKQLIQLLKLSPLETWVEPHIMQKIEFIFDKKSEMNTFSSIFLSFYSSCVSLNPGFKAQMKIWLQVHLPYNTLHQSLLVSKDILHPAAFIPYVSSYLSSAKNQLFLLDGDASPQVLRFCYETISQNVKQTKGQKVFFIWSAKPARLMPKNEDILSRFLSLAHGVLNLDLYLFAANWEAIALSAQMNYLFLDAEVYYFDPEHPCKLYLNNTNLSANFIYLEPIIEQEVKDRPSQTSWDQDSNHGLASGFDHALMQNQGRRDDITDLLNADFLDELAPINDDVFASDNFVEIVPSILYTVPGFKVCVTPDNQNYLVFKQPFLRIENLGVNLDGLYEELLQYRDPQLMQSALFYFNHQGVAMRSEKYSEALHQMALVALIDAMLYQSQKDLCIDGQAFKDPLASAWYATQAQQRRLSPDLLDLQFSEKWQGYHKELLPIARQYLAVLEGKQIIPSPSHEDIKWLMHQLALSQFELSPKHYEMFSSWLDLDYLEFEEGIRFHAYLKLSLKEKLSLSFGDRLMPHHEKIVVMTVQYKKSHGDLQNARKLINQIFAVSKQALPIYWIVFSDNPPQYLQEIEKKINKLLVFKPGDYLSLLRTESLVLLHSAHLFHTATAHHIPKIVHLLLDRLVKETIVISEYDNLHQSGFVKGLHPLYIKTGLSGQGIYLEETFIRPQLIKNFLALSKTDDERFYAYYSPYALETSYIGHLGHLLTTLVYCKMNGNSNLTIYGNCNLNLDFFRQKIPSLCGFLLNNIKYIGLRVHSKSNEFELIQVETLIRGSGDLSVTYINPFVEQVDASVCSALMDIGKTFIGGTGDHSLVEIILNNKLPLYEVVPWKDNLLLSLIRRCEQLNLGILAKFFSRQRLQVKANPKLGFEHDLYVNSIQLAFFLLKHETILMNQIAFLSQHIKKHSDISRVIQPKIRELVLAQEDNVKAISGQLVRRNTFFAITDLGQSVSLKSSRHSCKRAAPHRGSNDDLILPLQKKR